MHATEPRVRPAAPDICISRCVSSDSPDSEYKTMTSSAAIRHIRGHGELSSRFGHVDSNNESMESDVIEREDTTRQRGTRSEIGTVMMHLCLRDRKLLIAKPVIPWGFFSLMIDGTRDWLGHSEPQSAVGSGSESQGETSLVLKEPCFSP